MDLQLRALVLKVDQNSVPRNYMKVHNHHWYSVPRNYMIVHNHHWYSQGTHAGKTKQPKTKNPTHTHKTNLKATAKLNTVHLSL